MDYGENRPQNTFIDNIMDDIAQSPNKPISKMPSLETAETSTSFFSWMQNISWVTWLLVFLVLAFLGFNIFVYLAKGATDITTIFAILFQKIADLFGFVAVETTKQAAQASAPGINVIAGATTGALMGAKNATLQESVNNSGEKKENQNYEADDSYSKIQGTSGKSGWCYIGQEKAIRTCAKVGESDVCMSGDIFPSSELCVNPSLRT
jgi:hypothetical protein